MLLGIFFLLRRRKQVVLGIVVDHGFCQDLVILVALGCLKLPIHKCCNLIHIQINSRYILRTDMIHPIQII